MEKSTKITLLILVSISILILYFIKPDYENESVETALIKSFNSSGAEVLRTEIYFTGVIKKSSKSFEEQKLFAEGLAEQIGVLKNKAFLSRQIRNDVVQKIEVSGTTKRNWSVDINLQINEVTNRDNENVITVSITEYMSEAGFEEIKKDVMSILNRNKIRPKVNLCITGSIPGKYENSQINKICDKILGVAEAEKISTINDKDLISVSAYSHFLGSTIGVSGKKMNLNLAIRYNSLEDKTYIWLATPVITVEY